jgi:hypothetical protein
MDYVHVEASNVVDARPEAVYEILADYASPQGHRAILPAKYFGEMVVEEGGRGAGTVIQVETKALGVRRTLHMEVSEPEPGRVLVEKTLDGNTITSFIVEPLDRGRASRVTIATDFKPAPGVAGWVEKRLNPMVMRRIYREELQQLAEYVSRTPQRVPERMEFSH